MVSVKTSAIAVKTSSEINTSSMKDVSPKSSIRIDKANRDDERDDESSEEEDQSSKLEKSINESSLNTKSTNNIETKSIRYNAKLNKTLIVLIGAPGCGKGTQVKKIQEKYKIDSISIGDILREKSNELDLKTRLASGMLLDSDYINSVLNEALNKCKTDFVILDGYPRKIDQAKHISSFHKHVIYLDVPRSAIEQRIMSRMLCSKCNETFGPQETHGCGPEFITKRSDDNVTAIFKRFDEYLKNTIPLLNYYAKNLHTIDASKSIDEVFNNINSILLSMKIDPKKSN